MDDIKIQPDIVLAETCYFLNISTPDLSSYKDLNEKVNQASMPKFPILAKTATQAAGILRASKFDRIVEFGKKLGLKRVYRGGEDQLPMISSMLNNYFVDPCLKGELIKSLFFIFVYINLITYLQWLKKQKFYI